MGTLTSGLKFHLMFDCVPSTRCRVSRSMRAPAYIRRCDEMAPLPSQRWGPSVPAGRTVILVTHHIEEAVYLADRIVLMCANPGRIEEIYPVPVEQRRMRDAIDGADLRKAITAQMHQASGG